MDVGLGRRQRIIHYSKMTKTCLGEFVSCGFEIHKVSDTQNMLFKPNGVDPYKMMRNEREVLHNGYVKGKKWSNKAKSEIMKQLCPKLLKIFPEQINETFMILSKWMDVDKNNNLLKIKDDKNISSD